MVNIQYIHWLKAKDHIEHSTCQIWIHIIVDNRNSFSLSISLFTSFSWSKYSPPLIFFNFCAHVFYIHNKGCHYIYFKYYLAIIYTYHFNEFWISYTFADIQFLCRWQSSSNLLQCYSAFMTNLGLKFKYLNLATASYFLRYYSITNCLNMILNSYTCMLFIMVKCYLPRSRFINRFLTWHTNCGARTA